MQNLSYPERLEAINLPTLAYRRLRVDMIETFKIITGIYDSEVSPSLIIAPQYTRGHRYKIFKLRARLNIRKNFFMIRIVDIWNNLSDHVVSAPSVKSFES